jgi:epoxyqueuosine reductase
MVASVLELKRRARELGFDAVGIAPLEANPHGADLDRWLAQGHAGTMTYLQRQADKRKSPQRIMPEARSAVVTLTNYYHGQRPTHADTGRVAQYAWSRDYHDVLAERHERLAGVIRDFSPGAQCRCYVDAGPVPERELARAAGLGWIAKNTMLIHPAIGSFTFIGVVLTTAPLPPDAPFEADRCGSCRACLEACPTEAFVAPHVLDARRCISYLTIEHRGEFTDVERHRVNDWVFGCDICQDVCPWNMRFAQRSGDHDLAPRPELATPDLDELACLTPAGFVTRYGDTAFARAGAAGMRRNAAAVLANRRRAE